MRDPVKRKSNIFNFFPKPSISILFFCHYYWVGQKVHIFFHKVKDTFFIFTNNFILIFLVCQLSPAWYNVDCSQLMSQFDHYQFQHVYPTMEHRPVKNLQHETSQTTFDTFDQSQHLLHTLHKSFFFLHFSCIFTFLEIIKHNMLKILHIFFYLQY